jgi:hypothetical protein
VAKPADAVKPRSGGDRIVIALNVMIRTTIETITARLELKIDALNLVSRFPKFASRRSDH